MRKVLASSGLGLSRASPPAQLVKFPFGLEQLLAFGFRLSSFFSHLLALLCSIQLVKQFSYMRRVFSTSLHEIFKIQTPVSYKIQIQQLQLPQMLLQQWVADCLCLVLFLPHSHSHSGWVVRLATLPDNFSATLHVGANRRKVTTAEFSQLQWQNVGDIMQLNFALLTPPFTLFPFHMCSIKLRGLTIPIEVKLKVLPISLASLKVRYN